MKNKFNLVALLAIGLVTISCTTDTEEVNSTSQNQKGGVSAKTTDSIPKIPPTTFASDDGVIPPIKPKP